MGEARSWGEEKVQGMSVGEGGGEEKYGREGG